MGLLGMLAAGGAIGARDASNANVRAQNNLELLQAQDSIQTNREMLRQEYLDKRYNLRRADSLESAKNTALLNEQNYQRNRADKIADEETGHKRKLQIEGVKESGRNARANARIAASKNAGGKSGVDGDEGFNPKSPEGKAALDLVKSGRVKNLDEGYDEIQRMKLFSGLASNQFMSDPKQLFSFYDNYKMERAAASQNTSGPGVNLPQASIRNFNPKTGKFE